MLGSGGDPLKHFNLYGSFLKVAKHLKVATPFVILKRPISQCTFIEPMVWISVVEDLLQFFSNCNFFLPFLRSPFSLFLYLGLLVFPESFVSCQCTECTHTEYQYQCETTTTLRRPLYSGLCVFLIT